jgi:HK97 family phage major capsid protein
MDKKDIEGAPAEEAVETSAPEATEEEAVKSILEAVEARVNAGLETKTAEIKKELNEQVKAWEAKQTGARKSAVSFDGKAFDAWAKTVKSGSKGEFSFEIKDLGAFIKSTAGDMGVGDNYDGTVALSELDSMVSRDPQRAPFIEELVSVGTISAPIDTWIETTDETGAPLTVAELAEIPQKEWEFTEKTAPVRKVGVYSKYSKEMADDLPNLINEVRNFLVADLRRAVDEQILAGDGTGEDLKGILEYATAYSAGAFAGTVKSANHFDVVETAASQVLTALHNPNYVIVHPTDAAKMNLAKDDNGAYVMPPFITAGGATVSGLRVVVNTGIDAGTFLVGDFTKSSVKYRQGLTVEMSNSDGSDFVRDRFTVKATVRLVHRIRDNDVAAFVTGSFATAIAALDDAS